jgi:hypothetical protein
MKKVIEMEHVPFDGWELRKKRKLIDWKRVFWAVLVLGVMLLAGYAATARAGSTKAFYEAREQTIISECEAKVRSL